MGENLHRKKLFGGLQTAEEYHSEHAFPPNARCQGCKTRGVTTRIIVYYPVDEVKKRDPAFAAISEVSPQKFLALLMQTKSGPMVRISTVYACKQCTPTIEKAAAKGPSWALVDINRGPGPDKAVAGPGS
ncbi:hypothetical protein LCGC14_0414580 [marine sediment metagenome]|uniref:Uncharacterized protein n=1 Tax=marine sediment metagenome TaxID=412755 RepID=A0A0F9W1W5_9ZZZZ